MLRARAIVSGKTAANKKARQVAERMVQLSSWIISDLEQAQAPFHVFRWVAWGANATAQRRRADLVLLLRKSIDRKFNGWLEERHIAAALAVLTSAIEASRKRGGIAPSPSDIPIAVYEAAVAGATKGKSAPAETIEVAAAEAASVNGEDESEGVEVENDEPPSSQRLPTGRRDVLRRLSETLRAALTANDVEAADAICATISHLCGGRQAG